MAEPFELTPGPSPAAYDTDIRSAIIPQLAYTGAAHRSLIYALDARAFPSTHAGVAVRDALDPNVLARVLRDPLGLAFEQPRERLKFTIRLLVSASRAV